MKALVMKCLSWLWALGNKSFKNWQCLSNSSLFIANFPSRQHHVFIATFSRFVTCCSWRSPKTQSSVTANYHSIFQTWRMPIHDSLQRFAGISKGMFATKEKHAGFITLRKTCVRYSRETLSAMISKIQRYGKKLPTTLWKEYSIQFHAISQPWDSSA